MRKRSDLFPKNINAISVSIIFSLGRSTCTLYMICGWSSTRVVKWWHFLPSLYCFGGIFRHYFSILMALSATITFFSLIWVVALFAVTLLFWRRFSPPTFAFWRHFLPPHFFGSICAGALSAPTLWFWGRFLPPFSCFGGAFCPHTVFAYSVVSFSIASASDITFSAISAPSSGNTFV